MDDRETAGVVTIGFGIVVLVASLAADLFGIGEGGNFGPDQIGGALLGVIVLIVGLLLTLRDWSPGPH